MIIIILGVYFIQRHSHSVKKEIGKKKSVKWFMLRRQSY